MITVGSDLEGVGHSDISWVSMCICNLCLRPLRLKKNKKTKKKQPFSVSPLETLQADSNARIGCQTVKNYLFIT